MFHSYFFHVHYADVGMKLIMKPHIFEEIILNSACRASDDDGFGIPDLNRQGKSWVLARFMLDVIEWPRLKDDLEIETWVESYRLGFSMRNFRIYRLNEGRKLIARSKCAWAVIDLVSRENVNIFNDPIFVADGEKMDLHLDVRPDKSAEVFESEYTIQYADIDQNGHCNSAALPVYHFSK